MAAVNSNRSFNGRRAYKKRERNGSLCSRLSLSGRLALGFGFFPFPFSFPPLLHSRSARGLLELREILAKLHELLANRRIEFNLRGARRTHRASCGGR